MDDPRRQDHHRRFTRTEAENEALGHFDVSSGLVDHLTDKFRRDPPRMVFSLDQQIGESSRLARDAGIKEVLDYLRGLLKGEQG